MERTNLHLLILGFAAIALVATVSLFLSNRTLNADLATMKAARASVEKEAKAANERANIAERSIEEIKAEMSRVQAANETVNHSVTQLRNQLEQVQIQANTARGDFEARLKTSGDELGKVQGDLARAQEDLAKERAAKEEAQKAATDSDRLRAELKQAQDEVAKQKAAREESERLARESSGSAGASTGAPPSANP